MGKESGGGRSVSAGAGSGGASRPSTKPKKAVWVWCQCDQCEKWRKLPPATTVDENAPWYCYMNPDERRNECSDSEESYDAATEQQVFDDSSGDEQVLSPRQQQQQRGGRGHGRKGKGKRGRPPVPKSGGRLANGSGNWTPGGKGSGKAVRWENGAQEGGQYKRGAAAMESPEYQTGAKRQRTGAPPSGPASRLGAGPSRLGPSGSGQAPLDGMAGQYGGYGIKPEDQGPQQLSPQGSLRKLRGVNKAKKAHTGFEKIMGSGGIWEIVKGRGRAVTAPPQWIWEGLATYAPQAAELACQAADVASAAKYFETAVEPANLEQAKQAAVTSRIALATAAAIAAATTARITTAAGDPPAVVPVWGTPQPIPSGMPPPQHSLPAAQQATAGNAGPVNQQQPMQWQGQTAAPQHAQQQPPLHPQQAGQYAPSSMPRPGGPMYRPGVQPAGMPAGALAQHLAGPAGSFPQQAQQPRQPGTGPQHAQQPMQGTPGGPPGQPGPQQGPAAYLPGPGQAGPLQAQQNPLQRAGTGSGSLGFGPVSSTSGRQASADSPSRNAVLSPDRVPVPTQPRSAIVHSPNRMPRHPGSPQHVGSPSRRRLGSNLGLLGVQQGPGSESAANHRDPRLPLDPPPLHLDGSRAEPAGHVQQPQQMQHPSGPVPGGPLSALTSLIAQQRMAGQPASTARGIPGLNGSVSAPAQQAQLPHQPPQQGQHASPAAPGLAQPPAAAHWQPQAATTATGQHPQLAQANHYQASPHQATHQQAPQRQSPLPGSMKAPAAENGAQLQQQVPPPAPQQHRPLAHGP